MRDNNFFHSHKNRGNQSAEADGSLVIHQKHTKLFHFLLHRKQDVSRHTARFIFCIPQAEFPAAKQLDPLLHIQNTDTVSGELGRLLRIVPQHFIDDCFLPFFKSAACITDADFNTTLICTLSRNGHFAPVSLIFQAMQQTVFHDGHPCRSAIYFLVVRAYSGFSPSERAHGAQTKRSSTVITTGCSWKIIFRNHTLFHFLPRLRR